MITDQRMLASTTSGDIDHYLKANASYNYGTLNLKNSLPPVHQDEVEKKYPQPSGSFDATLDFKSNSS